MRAGKELPFRVVRGRLSPLGAFSVRGGSCVRSVSHRTIVSGHAASQTYGVHRWAGCVRGVVENSGCFPTLAGAWVVELPTDMPKVESKRQPRVVHLFPRSDGWILMTHEKGEQGMHFTDLGRALDAATSDDCQVHVVVHKRGAA